MAWLKETYPGRTSTDGTDAFAQVWLAHTSSRETLLAAWDEGGCTAAIMMIRRRAAWCPLFCPTTTTLPKWKAGAVQLQIDGGADG